MTDEFAAQPKSPPNHESCQVSPLPEGSAGGNPQVSSCPSAALPRNKFHILSVDFLPLDCYNSTAVEKEEYAFHSHTERASRRLKVRSDTWLRKVALEADG